MFASKALAIGPTLRNRDELALLQDQAKLLIDSGFLPKSVDTPAKAITIMLKGREIGVPEMHALSHINIINGKPCMSSELMLSQIYRFCPGARVNYTETNDQRCVIEAQRPGGKPATFSFSVDDAKRAGLIGKGTWQQYPKAMLRWRCVSEMARAMFPDALMGISYTPEELGADLDEDGGVLDVEPLRLREPVDELDDDCDLSESHKAAATAEQKQTVAPTGEIFRGAKEQLERLSKYLEKHKVPQHLHPVIASKLEGRLATELPEIMRQAIAEDGKSPDGAA